MKSGKMIASKLITLIVSVGLPLLFIRKSIYTPIERDQLFNLMGKFFGFTAFVVFFLQYAWTARFHFLEKLLPYDRRIAIHRTLGFSGFMLLTLHPFFILLSYNLIGMSLYFSIEIYLGFFAFLLLLIISASTFLGRIWQVKYESWKKIHFVSFAVLTLAYYHSMGIGSDLYGSTRIWWTFLWLLHVLLIAGKVVSKIRAWSPSYKVKEVIENNPSTNTLVIEKPRNMWKAGQFGFLSLKRSGKWEGWHPFSLTSLSSDENLTVAIKALGDFSSTIGETNPGDPVKLNPGFGGFTREGHRDEKYTMIAGGVGITPIYAMLKEMSRSDDSPPVRLIYTVHHESEILFRADLESWFSSRPAWELIIVVTSQPDWEGVRGRLTPARTSDLCQNDFSGTFFLCGPAPMIKTLGDHLICKGVSKNKIVNEYFVFLP